MIKTWRNVANNLQRRLIIIFFKKFVSPSQSDPLLKTKLKNELPMLIQKWNRAYLEAVILYNEVNLFEVLPTNLKESIEESLASTHPLSLFFSDTSLYTRQDGEFTQFSIFKVVFVNWYESMGNNTKTIKWDKDFYESIFDFYNIKVENKKTSTALKPIPVLTGILLTQETIDTFGIKRISNNNDKTTTNKLSTTSKSSLNTEPLF